MDKRTVYWVELAEYDLETARVMLSGGRLLYVGFMCHQIIEKALKAYYSAVRNDSPPYIHNLKRLASEGGIYEGMSDELKDLLDVLEPLNIEARYPTYKEDLARAMTPEFCKNLLQRTEALFLWIKQLLLNT